VKSTRLIHAVLADEHHDYACAHRLVRRLAAPTDHGHGECSTTITEKSASSAAFPSSTLTDANPDMFKEKATLMIIQIVSPLDGFVCRSPSRSARRSHASSSLRPQLHSQRFARPRRRSWSRKLLGPTGSPSVPWPLHSRAHADDRTKHAQRVRQSRPSELSR